jgi:hypothetical protein
VLPVGSFAGLTSASGTPAGAPSPGSIVASLPNVSKSFSQLSSNSWALGRSPATLERHFVMLRLSMRSFRRFASFLSGSSHGRGWRPTSWEMTSAREQYRSKTGESVRSSYAMTPIAQMSMAGVARIVFSPASNACSTSGAAYRALKASCAIESAFREQQ